MFDWIQDLINKDTLMTGLLCSEDIDMIESAVADENGIVNVTAKDLGTNKQQSITITAS